MQSVGKNSIAAGGDSSILLKVTLPNEEHTKTLKFNLNDTWAQAMFSIDKSLKREHNKDWGIFLPHKQKWVDSSALVSEAKLQPRDHIEYLSRVEERKETLSNLLHKLLLATGTLKVKVIAGRQLAAKDFGNVSDPFVAIELVNSDGKVQKVKTKTQKKTLDPVWNEEFSFKISSVWRDELRFVVWDWDIYSANDFMGQFTFPVKKLVSVAKVGPCPSLTTWIDVQTNEKNEDVSGAIQLEFNLTIDELGGEEIGLSKVDPVPEDADDFIGMGESIENHYEIGEAITQTAIGWIKACKSKATGEQFVVKMMDKSSARASKEAEILKTLRHPNIVAVTSIFEDAKYLYLVMEKMEGGELFDKIIEKGFFTEAEAAPIIRNLLSAIAYAHDMGVTHRDLKPENLLIKSATDITNVKIAGFGHARFASENMMKTLCGTPDYLAPEMLTGEGYGNAADVWSLGVITYVLLCGYPPFYAENENLPQLFQLIMKAQYKYDPKLWGHISKEAKDFIDNLLKRDANERLTARQALDHPWFKVRHSQEKVKLQKRR